MGQPIGLILRVQESKRKPVAPVWNFHRESVGSEKSQFVATSWMEESVVVIAARERERETCSVIAKQRRAHT